MLINFIFLFLLSNTMLNLENISFLPRINGLFLLVESAQVISIGTAVILAVILVIYPYIVPPSIPLKCILGRLETLIPKSWATDSGMMLQSAPVSTRKSNFWYPYFVKTGIEMIGSGIIPNCVCFWFKGNSERINADSFLRRDKTDSKRCPVNMFLGKFLRQLRIGPCVHKDFIALSGNVIACVMLLKFCVRNRFHFYHLIERIPQSVFLGKIFLRQGRQGAQDGGAERAHCRAGGETIRERLISVNRRLITVKNRCI